MPCNAELLAATRGHELLKADLARRATEAEAEFLQKGLDHERQVRSQQLEDLEECRMALDQIYPCEEEAGKLRVEYAARAEAQVAAEARATELATALERSQAMHRANQEELRAATYQAGELQKALLIAARQKEEAETSVAQSFELAKTAAAKAAHFEAEARRCRTFRESLARERAARAAETEAQARALCRSGMARDPAQATEGGMWRIQPAGATGSQP